MIVNLTQHLATDEQKEAGVVDLPEELRKELTTALTFDKIPTRKDLVYRARDVENILIKFLRSGRHSTIGLGNSVAITTELKDMNITCMLGGAPYFMSALERTLEQWCRVVYAFSLRESIDEKQEDGTIRKVSVFKHKGFVEA